MRPMDHMDYEEAQEIVKNKIKYWKNHNKKYIKNSDIGYNNASISDMDDYLDSLAAISKSYVHKEIKVVISPVPENIDEAMDFLKGLE